MKIIPKFLPSCCLQFCIKISCYVFSMCSIGLFHRFSRLGALFFVLKPVVGILLSHDHDLLLFSNICLFICFFCFLISFGSSVSPVCYFQSFYGSSVSSYICFLSLLLSATIPSWSSCSGNLFFCCLQLST